MMAGTFDPDRAIRATAPLTKSCGKVAVEAIRLRMNSEDRIWLYGFKESGVYHVVVTDKHDKVVAGEGGYPGSFKGNDGFFVSVAAGTLPLLQMLTVGEWLKYYFS